MMGVVGENWPVILAFGGPILGFYLFIAIIVMGVEAIRRFIR